MSLKQVWETGPRMFYLDLLNLGPGAARAIDLIAGAQATLDEVRAHLEEGWREQLVGALACLLHAHPAELLWEAFDRASWVSPQLGICAMLLDPGDFAPVRKRLLLRCPNRLNHLEGTDPAWRHAVHGTSLMESHNLKGMAALVHTYARLPEGQTWMGEHVPLADAVWALDVDTWDHGDQIAANWASRLARLLKGRVPGWLTGRPPRDLLTMWDLKGQPRAVRSLCRGPWERRAHRLFHPLVAQGYTSFVLDGDSRRARLRGRGLTGMETLVELPGPFLIPALWNHLVLHGEMDLSDHGDQPTALRVEAVDDRLEITALDQASHRVEPRFQIVDRGLEDCPASLWIIGIDGTASMDGGVSAAVRAAAGPELQAALQAALARTGRSPGEVVITPGYGCKGVTQIASVVTLPSPGVAGLCAALEKVISFAHKRHGSLAMPALGCGAGGLKARDVAGPLVAILAPFARDMRITLALPRAQDRQAFAAAARSQGLIGAQRRGGQ